MKKIQIFRYRVTVQEFGVNESNDLNILDLYLNVNVTSLALIVSSG